MDGGTAQVENAGLMPVGIVQARALFGGWIRSSSQSCMDFSSCAAGVVWVWGLTRGVGLKL